MSEATDPARTPGPAPPAAASAASPAGDGAPLPLTPEQARLLPFYHDLRNEIVEPERVVVSSQYFWARWAPRLGPTLTSLIVCLRRHCYYNKITQERRDWCFPEQATLAREIGVESTKTIRAALQEPLAAYFVRREPRYVYDPKRGKRVRTSDMYFVAMDDPLIPEDEALLTLRATERLLSEGRGSELDLDSRGHRPLAAPTGQKRRQVSASDGRSPTGQKRHQIGSPTGRSLPQDSREDFAPEIVPEEDTSTTKYSMIPSRLPSRVAGAFAAANDAPPTPAQLARLAELVRQFDPLARGQQPPTSGEDWIVAAIAEAVESGSRFVAPRRIARICDRWAAEGFPGKDSLSPGGLPGSSPDPPKQPEDDNRPAAVEPSLSSDSLSSFSVVPSFVVFPELGVLSRPFWQTLCDEARRRLAAPGDLRLLSGSVLVAREGMALVVGVPGRAASERANRRLPALLEPLARTILGRSVELRFVALDDLSDRDGEIVT
jgi:hypothetical protein